jgi:phosphotransferase system  glucose/maltose/N-acetylglucosamine-specific IIC component
MITAGGRIKLLLILMTLVGILDSSSQTYPILSAIGDAPYYFLPFKVAVTAAKYFHTDS